MWEKCKGVGGAICGSFGLVASIATILGYLSITPDQAASFLGHAFLLAAPAITFACGAIAGWGFTKQASDKKAREFEAVHAGKLDEMKSAHAAEATALKAAHAEEVAELNVTHAAEIAEKDAEIARLKSDHDAPPERPEPSLDAIMALSQRAAAGVLDALRRLDDGERYVRFGDHIEDSLWLIGNSNGMIERHVTYFNGYHSRRDEYFVVPEWAAFLSIPENRKALERMAFCSRWPN